jgi:multicopper oxidase
MASVGNRVGDHFHSAFNSTLINGKGRYPDGPSTDLAIVNVEQGKRLVLYFIQHLGMS